MTMELIETRTIPYLNKEKNISIYIDLERDKNLDAFAIRTIEDRYLVGGETSPQEAFARAATQYADSAAHAQRLYDYASSQWFTFATPVLANGGTERGLPISCFLNHVEDSINGINDHYNENGFLSTRGGGIGSYWGNLRSKGEKTSRGNETPGVIPFIHVEDAQMLAFKQGATRRGSSAAYLDIWHPEIEEFILMRKPTGGDIHRKNLNLHHGINIDDAFMEAVIEGSSYVLRDPKSGEAKGEVDARSLWKTILKTRVATGEPYIHFIDTTNRKLPVQLKNKGLHVSHSNLCSEITLPTSSDRTAVCCLSSINVEKYEEWVEEERFVEDLVRMLDNVLEEFIRKAPPEMKKATYSAYRERSIGLGVLGFHSLLQRMNIPFEGPMAIAVNRNVFKHIKERAVEASKKLGRERGEAPDMGGSGLRFAHLMAIAPNASSSIIGCTSPSIEPWRANIYVHKTLSGSFVVKNPYLLKLLKEKGHDTPDVWESIIEKEGSVDHLSFLTEDEKKVFRTAMEIDQNWVIQHAGDRQEFICQAQSLNIFVPSDVNFQDLHRIHMDAWKKGLKTLYYCRSTSARQAEKVTESSQNLLDNEVDKKDNGGTEECFMCEG